MMDYLYYSIYRWLSKTSENDIAEYTTIIIIAVGISSNAVVIIGMLFSRESVFFSNKIYMIALLILLAFSLYVRFVRNERYKMLEEKFHNNINDTQIKKMNTVALLFIIESFLV